MIIVISGPSGSGKTTVAKILSDKLKLRFVSAGQLFREMAANSGKDIIEMNKSAEKKFDIDRLIDKRILDEAEKGNVIIESHIAGWLLSGISDYTIYLWANIEERAKRISIRDKISYEEALIKIMEREQSHYFRFWKYYGIDLLDLTPFDIVINTSNLDISRIVNIILTYIGKNTFS
ncbi:(d)CMP kinase [Acidianus sp. HS-5]|uniref:(d)CMP kinase n=1 Tax=Acidianus sp. HS-5 TaxID=2886040 RepID=UPI001F2A207D|nr:AAA family ATPase [Acidianus sp. HS-5]BDC19355.1 cytidylate kinase [Acidianus sp. HS-5]